MKFIVIARLPTEAGNQMIADPNMLSILETYLKDINAETAYFSEDQGERTFYVIVDLPTADMMPAVAEPLFRLGARVELHPTMTWDDLKKAMQQRGQS